MTNINRKVRQFATLAQCSVIALVLMNVCASRTLAQDGHSHMATQEHEMAAAEPAGANTLLQVVRDATERFKDVAVAEAEGYALQFGCVTGPDSGAMGLHYVNGTLVNSGVLDATHPQIVIYEADARRRPERLIGADFLVIADAWNATHSSPPELMGSSFICSRSPQSLRAAGVLHAACLGVEGQSQRRVRELAPQRFVPVIRGPVASNRQQSNSKHGSPARAAKI